MLQSNAEKRSVWEIWRASLKISQFIRCCFDTHRATLYCAIYIYIYIYLARNKQMKQTQQMTSINTFHARTMECAHQLWYIRGGAGDGVGWSLMYI